MAFEEHAVPNQQRMVVLCFSVTNGSKNLPADHTQQSATHSSKLLAGFDLSHAAALCSALHAHACVAQRDGG